MILLTSSISLIFLKLMQTHILHCGFLKVRAEEMIKPLSADQIRDKYHIDSEGYMKLSMNALVVEGGNRVVLMDPGCADFLPPRLVKEYGLVVSNSIEEQERFVDDYDHNEQNPFDIISKSIDIEHMKPMKKRKTLGVPKSRILLDTSDIYEDKDDDNIIRNYFSGDVFQHKYYELSKIHQSTQ